MTSKLVPPGEELDRVLRETFTFGPEIISYKGFQLKKRFLDFAERVENFEVHDTDTWVCTYPKSGTTWTVEMVWCIVNDLTFDTTKQPRWKRLPFFEGQALGMGLSHNLRKGSLDVLDECTGPRVIKTHLPFKLLPKQIRTGETQAKVIYVTRNSKDVCISSYHFHRGIGQYTGSFEDFCSLFVSNKQLYAPLWDHIQGYHQRKDILFLSFEDMKKDLASVIKRVSNFLNCELSAEDIENVKNHLSFENMKKNPAMNPVPVYSAIPSAVEEKVGFMRCGKTEQWRNEMDPEIIAAFDNWNRENLKKRDMKISGY